ncbi:carbon-nitrogen hydrolase family protein [Pseudalkalibacillus caeni]|uniref:Carbon-nitrogen hydrolase family protein n=1 Tax=Exobacillus caeni TaxID=2574798 RepID=A0A5R9F8L1_9BACL|nr:carbon-nitrogen hydrolase family protein [Pseudalkalibacillus caeni]TLS38656.1 carbon-nitrogen hydrolase family protein [Pseudalkalibacillus caeni]
MKTQQITVAQAAFQNGDIASNIKKMEDMVNQCKIAHPETRLIIFPELAATGYFLTSEIKELAQTQDGPISQRMRKAAQQYEVNIVYGYVEKDTEGKIYNAIQLVGPDGNAEANYRKIHLTPLERGIFTAGSELVTVQTDIGKIGLMICWDLAFPELSRALALKGADILIAPSAWEDPYDAPFTQFGAARAIDNTVYVAACNHVGESGELTFFGKSAIYGPDGQTIKTAAKYEDTLITATLDEEWRKEIKESFFTMLEERRTDVYET